MKALIPLASSAAILALAGCTPGGNESDMSDTAETATADDPELGSARMQDKNGDPVGLAKLLDGNPSLTLALNLNGLTPGTKALHLHTKGACEAPDFASAEGHLNPFDRAHGSKSPDGQHLGDLPNIEVSQDGTARIEIAIDAPTADALQHIFDKDGTAIVLHDGPDDYLTDPSGNAGSRIACGVLERA